MKRPHVRKTILWISRKPQNPVGFPYEPPVWINVARQKGANYGVNIVDVFLWECGFYLIIPLKMLISHGQNHFFDEHLIERGSMYGHFALSGSPWGAIWGRLLKNAFSRWSKRFSERNKYVVFFGKQFLRKSTSYGTSGRSARGKITVHWFSFY